MSEKIEGERESKIENDSFEAEPEGLKDLTGE